MSFMDSSGLGLIMGRYSVMKDLEGEMTVWNPSPETRAILTLAGMERLVRIEYPQGQGPSERPRREASGAGSTAPSPRTGSRRRKKKSLASETITRKEKQA